MGVKKGREIVKTQKSKYLSACTHTNSMNHFSKKKPRGCHGSVPSYEKLGIIPSYEGSPFSFRGFEEGGAKGSTTKSRMFNAEDSFP